MAKDCTTLLREAQVLVTDYDGTVADHGTVLPETLAALAELRAAGRKIVLCSGRELEDLGRVFPAANFRAFDLMVLENGAILYNPHTKVVQVVSAPPSLELAQALRARGVDRLSVGRSIIATFEPWGPVVEEEIRRLNLNVRVILNKDAVMVLPEGVDKAYGTRFALEQLGIPAARAVGVGDAENDEPLLRSCGIGAAVANATPGLKAIADLQLKGARGKGTEELIGKMLGR